MVKSPFSFFSPILLCLLIVLQSFISISKPIKWGRVSEQDINLTECSYDPEASAVVLSESGEIIFSYNGNLTIKKHVRIKILKQNGLDQANIVIPYYFKDASERVSSIKAHTLNTDEQGNIIKHKVDKDHIFESDKSSDWKELKFSFPAVRAGSIIEYYYSVISKNVAFPDGWAFQREIPTLHSEFKAIIPKGLDYRVLIQGRRLQKKYSGTSNHWELSNLPAIKDEPFSPNPYDYVEKIRFQLAGYSKYERGNSQYVNLMTTWKSLAKELLSHYSYTRYLNRQGKTNEILQSVRLENDKNDLQKAKSVYNYVKDNLTWDGHYQFISDQNINSLLRTGKGNSAEINLFLTILLRETGIKADPALVSTRAHGKVFKITPYCHSLTI